MSTSAPRHQGKEDSRLDLVVTRRGFLRGGLSGVALTVGDKHTTLLAADPLTSFIDAHAHVWTSDTKRYPLDSTFAKTDLQPASFTPAELIRHAHPNGVKQVVLIQMSYYGTDNSYMLDAMRDHPSVFSGVAVVDDNEHPDVRMRELAKKGVRGFRIRPSGRQPDQWLTSDGMQAMWRCGAREGLAICHLIDPPYLPSVDRMCRQFPDTPVVIDHFARIGVDGTIRDSDLRQLCRLARHKNVTVKVSAFYALGARNPPYHDLNAMIRRVLDAFGPERLMWASDCPYQVQGNHTYHASIDLIRSGLESLSHNDRQWLLRKTAERVFFS